jgi:hypothetical protein
MAILSYFLPETMSALLRLMAVKQSGHLSAQNWFSQRELNTAKRLF